MNEKEKLTTLIEKEKNVNIIHHLYLYTRDFISIHSSERKDEQCSEEMPSDQESA